MYEKIKEFFKKNWLYFASFIGGIASSLFYVFRRNGRAKQDIKQLQHNISELRRKLQEGQRIVDQLESSNNELRIELQKRINETKCTVDQLEESTDSSGEFIKKLNQTNQELKHFIEKYGSTS